MVGDATAVAEEAAADKVLVHLKAFVQEQELTLIQFAR
jgi:hypothetical protein